MKCCSTAAGKSHEAERENREIHLLDQSEQKKKKKKKTTADLNNGISTTKIRTFQRYGSNFKKLFKLTKNYFSCEMKNRLV